MRTRDAASWMWGEALALLEQADRLHRQLMDPSPRGATGEPPVDVIESADEVLVHVALPGVSPADVAIAIEPGAITVAASRPFSRRRGRFAHPSHRNPLWPVRAANSRRPGPRGA